MIQDDAGALTRFSDERVQAILEERTRRLARRDDDAGEAAGRRSVMLCAVGDNLYGLPLEDALRVAPFGRVTAAPGRQRAYLGLAGQGGRLYDVFDLAVLLSLAPAPPSAPAGHLVLLKGSPPTALRVDDVPGVATVQPLDEPGRARVVSGVREAEDKIVVLITPADLLEPLQSLKTSGA